MGMSQEAFLRRYQDRWEELEEILDCLERKEYNRPVDSFPERYRKVCNHLAMARSRGYSLAIRTRLEVLVDRCHRALYKEKKDPWNRIWEYVAFGFAQDVRRDWPYLLAASVLFVVPFVGMLIWLALYPEQGFSVLGFSMVLQLEMMYGGEGLGAREADSDLMMFGFYIFNNVGIALRTFGAGVLAGVGSLLILLFNGFVLGAASGYVTGMGYGENFWSFVIGHGSFELTAIVLAGMAGLKIGSAPVWPGRYGRVEALRRAAKESVGVVLGFSVMLIIAAFIEAFWSPRDIEPMIHYVVGAFLWIFVLAYFAFAGRGRRLE